MVAQGDFLTAVGEIVLTDAGGKLAQLHAFVVETDEDLSVLAADRGSLATRPKIARIWRGRTRSDMADIPPLQEVAP